MSSVSSSSSSSSNNNSDNAVIDFIARATVRFFSDDTDSNSSDDSSMISLNSTSDSDLTGHHSLQNSDEISASEHFSQSSSDFFESDEEPNPMEPNVPINVNPEHNVEILEATPIVPNESSSSSRANVEYEPKYKKKCLGKDDLSQSLSEDDGSICTICFEQLTNAGDHRLSSLKCGHLFGHMCILKWLSGKGTKCPQCNEKAKKSDIRIIYAKSLKVLDTVELTRVLGDLDKERQLRRNLEMELAQVRMQYAFVKGECSRLKSQNDRSGMENISNVPGSSSDSYDSMPSANFSFVRSIEISKDGGCRVLSTCDALNMITVSQPSKNSLFPGFGVKKVSTMDFRTTEFVSLHSHPIRDMSFNSENPNGMLLSVSMDKAIKITSMWSNSVVQSYSYDMPLWSCAWNLDNQNQFFAGTVNGKILVFDSRNTREHIEIIQSTGSISPVVSMQYIKKVPSASFKYGGLLACQLEQCVFHHSASASEFKPNILPVQGNFTSINFEPNSRLFLLTSRPYQSYKQSRHFLNELEISNDSINSTPSIGCNIIQTMNGGGTHKMLSRSKLIPHPIQSEKILACAGDEASLSLMTWDASTGRLFSRIGISSPVLDVGLVKSSNNFVLSLTEKNLSIHKFD